MGLQVNKNTGKHRTYPPSKRRRLSKIITTLLDPQTTNMAQQMAADWDLPEANLSFEEPNEAFLYNRHNESIFDDVRYFPGLKSNQESVVKFDATNEDFINHATLRALIVQLTSPEVIDYNLICDFFLTYRTFTDSHTIMNLLLTRLIWSLQYVNSFKQDTEKIGKLVLLRTFVVLRHWILNYFIDDFLPDEKLCDTFSYYINQITHESHLIRANMVFELKIVTDLKIHWLSQINEFYKAGVSTDASQNIFAFLLPQSSEFVNIKKLSKSNTEASIHTNPSFRRSAMLSLYDQRTYHKCLIYDDSNANDENPQLSINNLLAQHKSSRVSLNDKLKDFQGKNPKKLEKRPALQKQSVNPAKHKYLNLTDSSLALKKTTAINESGKVDADKENITPAGFSTNGHVKLPSSKISVIVPLTPAKKMEYTLKKELPPTPKSNSHSHVFDGSDVDDFGRKKSLKKIVDGWKKSFNSPDLKNEKPVFADSAASTPASSPSLDSSKVIGDRVDVLSARIIDELEFLIRYYITDLSTINEADDRDYISRSAIEYSRLEDNELKVDDSITNRDKDVREEQLTLATMSALASKEQMSMQDLSELNIDKIDNLFSQDDILIEENIYNKIASSPEGLDSNVSQLISAEGDHSKRSSFGGRVASINWNDEGDLNLENSELIGDQSNNLEQDVKESHFMSDRMIKTSTQYFDVSSESPSQDPYLIERPTTPSSVSTPSDLENYNEEVSDLGIAMSPQSMQKTVHRISFNEHFNTVNRRISALSKNSSGSQIKRDSVKSYVSYDSAFSFSSVGKSTSREGNLRKKHGYHNLRKFADAPPSDVQKEDMTRDGLGISHTSFTGAPSKVKTASMNSQISRTTSLRRSLRLSTLCALTELPFNDFGDSTASFIRGNPDARSIKLPDLADSSVFSCMVTGRRSTRDSTKKSSDQSSTASVAIPGISNQNLKELAAIPDDSFSTGNPVQSALYKLEGRRKNDQSSTIVSADEETTSRVVNRESGIALSTSGSIMNMPQNTKVEDEDSEFNNTDNILAEINNAATEDVIDYSSEVEKELRERPITPIKTISKAFVMPSTSATNMNAMLTSVPNSEKASPFSLLNPKVVLDAYTLTSSSLSIESIIQNNSHVSFVLSCSSLSLAEHLTMIEKDMLQEIDWKELIELQWNKELTPVNSWLEIIVNEGYYSQNKGVNLVIARFNLMVNWVISEVLLTRTEAEQIAIISRFIHVAHHCLAMQNFSTVMQIVLALTSEKITKLRSTWKNLSPGDILTLKNLEELASPTKNFIKIRLCMNQLQPSRGCIPFVGLYLSDLVFNAERPKFVKTTAPVPPKTGAANQANEPLSASQTPVVASGTPKLEPTTSASTTSEPPMIPAAKEISASKEASAASTPTLKEAPAAPAAANATSESCERSVTIGESTLSSQTSDAESTKLINFSRFRTSVHIVKSLSQCIEWSRNYNFTVNEELLRKCLYIKSLDEEEMNYCLETLNI